MHAHSLDSGMLMPTRRAYMFHKLPGKNSVLKEMTKGLESLALSMRQKFMLLSSEDSAIAALSF